MVEDVYRYGWDQCFGGLKLFVNMKGGAAFQPMGDFKYWWPNSELEVGMLYAYVGTGQMEFLEKHRIVHGLMLYVFLIPLP